MQSDVPLICDPAPTPHRTLAERLVGLSETEMRTFQVEWARAIDSGGLLILPRGCQIEPLFQWPDA